jgi:hypothetical protein
VACGLSNDGVGGILLDVARTAPDFSTWQGVVFEVLEEVGYDVGFVKVLPPVCGFASRGFEQGLIERAREWWRRRLLHRCTAWARWRGGFRGCGWSHLHVFSSVGCERGLGSSDLNDRAFEIERSRLSGDLACRGRAKLHRKSWYAARKSSPF